MADNELFYNVNKVLNLITELNGMSLDDLKDICFQYGEENSFDNKSDLINTIMGIELSKKEMEDYQKYLRYYYFTVFREQMDGLSQIDRYIDNIQSLYEVKKESFKEKGRALDKKRIVSMQLSNEMPLVRLNIEYSHVENRYDSFIKLMTRTGMKLASLTESQEDIKKKGLIYSFLKKGTLASLSREEESYRKQRNEELDESYSEYEAACKLYSAFLKEAFYRMLDNRIIAEAVYLKMQLSNDFETDNAYKLGNALDHRFTMEEKGQILDEFITFANFDQEQQLTGEIFYNAVLKFITSYYDIMASRLSLRESDCIRKIEEIVSKEKKVVDGMKKNQEGLGIFTKEEEETLSLIHGNNGGIKK